MPAEPSRLRVLSTPHDTPKDAPATRSPGATVRDLRTRRGISLEQLAAATKIPVASLRHIESDEFDALPGPVFAKGFLRCCARALGVAPEHLVEPYEDWMHHAEGGTASPPAAAKSPQALAPASAGQDAPPAAPPRSRGPSGAWAAAKWRIETANLALWTVLVLFVLVVISAAFQLGAGSR